MNPWIGIDLGTSYSCVGFWKNGGVEIIANQENRITPSYTAFTDSERLIGDVAKNQAGRNPSNTVFATTQLMGRKFSDPIIQKNIKNWPFKVLETKDDQPGIQVEHLGESKIFSPEEISAMILQKMKSIAETHLGQSVDSAVIAVPTHFNSLQRQATKDAAKIAGLSKCRIINETTAVALAYNMGRKIRDERNILILNFGGGTSDSCLVCIENNFLVVKATAGIPIGGEDFDSSMVDHFLKEFARKNKGLDLSSNPRSMIRLRTACETAKRTLTEHKSASIELDAL